MTRRWRCAALSLFLALAAAGCSSGKGDPVASPVASASASGSVSPSVTAGAGWSSIAAGPLPARNNATTVWTGTEVLVFGGDDAYCPPGVTCKLILGPARSDGAAYDPAADSWRLIAAAPVPVREASAALVDRRVYVLVEPEGGRQTPSFLSYDIDADRWRQLPGPGAVAGGFSLATVGDLLVGYREHLEANGHDRYWDADADRWRDLPDAPNGPWDLRHIVDVGGTGILVGQGRQKGEGRSLDGLTALRLDPETRRWTALTSPQVERRASLDGAPWFSVDGLAVNVSYRSHRPRERGVLGGFVDVEDGWAPLPSPPRKLEDSEEEFAWAQASGSGYVVAGRFALHVPTRTWQEILDPLELSGFGGYPAVAWAGDRLFVWGGAQAADTPLDRGWTWRPSPLPDT